MSAIRLRRTIEALTNRRTIMRKRTRMITFVTAAALGIAALAQEASAEDATAQATYRDIEQTLGFVPSVFKLFPAACIAGEWAEFKSLQLSPKNKNDGKNKEMMGLAVASNVPGQY